LPWSGRTPGNLFSRAGQTPLRASGARAGRPGVPGRPSGFPRQPKRQRHSRGKGGPRKFFVRTAARSMAGVLPKTGAPPVTPRPGLSNRQRKESRLDRRMIFVPGRAAAFAFPPDDPGRGFSIRAPRQQSLFGSTPRRRGFPPQSRERLLSFRAGRLPVFRGGVIHPVPDDGTAPGFSNRGAARFFPIPAGQHGRDSRRPPDQSPARRSSSHPEQRRGSGFSNRERGPLLSRPNRTTARMSPPAGPVPGAAVFHPIRRTTDRRLEFHPGGTAASIPSRTTARPGVFQSRAWPASFPPQLDDGQDVAAGRISPERGGLHPIRRTTPRRRGFHPGGDGGGGGRPDLDAATTSAFWTTGTRRLSPS